MLTNYARWYSFTPPQWPTLSPPLTMEPDADIEAWAGQAAIHVLFGSERLVERLEELADVVQVRFPPTEEEIAEEVELVMPGVADPAPSAMGLQARQVIIQHADVVNIHTTAVDGVS